jgi:hypothetical protein
VPVLLRAESASHHEAIDVLERARAAVQKHKVDQTFALATIGGDLAVEAAPEKGSGTTRSMNFAPLFRSRWLVALESS